MKTLADFGFTADSFGFLILLFSVMFLLLAVIFAALFYAQAYGIYRMARWLQSLPTVIWEPKKIKSITVSIFPPSIYHEVMGLKRLPW